MIYGLRRMIYRAAHGMIEYPFLHAPKAYIMPEGHIILEEYITRSVRNGYHCKRRTLSRASFAWWT